MCCESVSVLAGPAEVVDLVADLPEQSADPLTQLQSHSDQPEGASHTAHSPVATSNQEAYFNEGNGKAEAEGQTQSDSHTSGRTRKTATAEKKTGRSRRSMQKAVDAAERIESNAETEKTVQRRSKSGLVVEMEEI